MTSAPGAGRMSGRTRAATGWPDIEIDQIGNVRFVVLERMNVAALWVFNNVGLKAMRFDTLIAPIVVGEKRRNSAVIIRSGCAYKTRPKHSDHGSGAQVN